MRKSLTEEQMLWAENLRRLWNQKKKELNLTQEKAGHILGWTQGGVGHYLNQKTPLNTDAKLKFADLLGVKVTEIDPNFQFQTSEIHTNGRLLFGSQDQQEMGQPIFTNIPILDVELAAGAGTHIDMERVTDWVPISQDWIQGNHLPKDHLVVVSVTGDSMSPRLQNGDMLLVNTADQKPISGSIYAIAVDNELRVKRLMKRMDGSWAISSDNKSNPAYQDEIISHHNFEQLRIIGRAVRVLMGEL